MQESRVSKPNRLLLEKVADHVNLIPERTSMSGVWRRHN